MAMRSKGKNSLRYTMAEKLLSFVLDAPFKCACLGKEMAYMVDFMNVPQKVPVSFGATHFIA